MSSSAVVRSVEVGVSSEAGGVVTLRYAIKGDMSRLRIPPIRAPRRADGLWQHTCFEAFARTSEPGAYREFNFSPSTEWAAYAFGSYRAGMTPVEEGWAPTVSTQGADWHFALDVVVRIAPPLHLALAAVVEEEDGKFTYWALRHPSDKPDFHHPESFALEL